MDEEEDEDEDEDKQRGAAGRQPDRPWKGSVLTAAVHKLRNLEG